MKEATAAIIAIGGFFIADRVFNEGQVTERIAEGGSQVTEVIRENVLQGGERVTEVVREVITETGQTAANAAQNIGSGVAGATGSLVPDLPSFDPSNPVSFVPGSAGSGSGSNFFTDLGKRAGSYIGGQILGFGQGLYDAGFGVGQSAGSRVRSAFTPSNLRNTTPSYNYGAQRPASRAASLPALDTINVTVPTSRSPTAGLRVIGSTPRSRAAEKVVIKTPNTQVNYRSSSGEILGGLSSARRQSLTASAAKREERLKNNSIAKIFRGGI